MENDTAEHFQLAPFSIYDATKKLECSSVGEFLIDWFRLDWLKEVRPFKALILSSVLSMPFSSLLKMRNIQWRTCYFSYIISVQLR